MVLKNFVLRLYKSIQLKIKTYYSVPMYEPIIKKIRESLDQDLFSSAYPKLSGDGCKPCKIDIKNFQEISPIETSRRIAFVDGGNAEIISTSNFSLNLIRVCYLICQDNKKRTSKKFEIFAFIQAKSENNEICYKTAFFASKNSIDLEELSFSSFDPTLMLGVNRAEIGSVANAVRRFAELKAAKLISDERLADIIVLDGNLQSTITKENSFLNQLNDSCIKNNVVLSALSKTTSIFTDNGHLLSTVLGSISPLKSWAYYPIAEINTKSHQAEMYFVKLNKNSDHVFRLEIFNKQKPMAAEVISILAENSVDPIFLGYPYGLIEADRAARVTNQEKEALKTIFMFKLKNRNVQKYLNSKNAHEILDRISF